MAISIGEIMTQFYNMLDSFIQLLKILSQPLNGIKTEDLLLLLTFLLCTFFSFMHFFTFFIITTTLCTRSRDNWYFVPDILNFMYKTFFWILYTSYIYSNLFCSFIRKMVLFFVACLIHLWKSFLHLQLKLLIHL